MWLGITSFIAGVNWLYGITGSGTMQVINIVVAVVLTIMIVATLMDDHAKSTARQREY